MEKKKGWIVMALCIAIVGMGIGFAALAQNLEISATANITGEWDIRITRAVPDSGIGGSPKSWTLDGTSATFEADLPHPGAWFAFMLEVENLGNIDAILSSVTGINATNSADPSEIKISYRVSHEHSNPDDSIYETEDANIGTALDAGQKKWVYVRFDWVMSPGGEESVIPDEKSKTVTINLNFTQNTP